MGKKDRNGGEGCRVVLVVGGWGGFERRVEGGGCSLGGMRGEGQDRRAGVSCWGGGGGGARWQRGGVL